jgi:hypothetical protein
MKFTGALLTVAGCALLAGCARPSTVSSQGFIVNAGYAIRAAEERKAADHAPNELNDARTKLVEAEKSFSANQMDRATRLAQQAVADAQLAEAFSARVNAEEALADAKRVEEENQALRREADRALRE